MKAQRGTVDRKLDSGIVRILDSGKAGESDSVTIIATASDGDIDELAVLIKGMGGVIRHQLRIVSAVSADFPVSEIEALARNKLVSEVELASTQSIA